MAYIVQCFLDQAQILSKPWAKPLNLSINNTKVITCSNYKGNNSIYDLQLKSFYINHAILSKAC